MIQKTTTTVYLSDHELSHRAAYKMAHTSAYGAQASMACTKLTTSSTVQRETTRLWCSSLAQADEQRGERDRGLLANKPTPMDKPIKGLVSLAWGLGGDEEGEAGDTGERERFTGGPDSDRSSGSPNSRNRKY